MRLLKLIVRLVLLHTLVSATELNKKRDVAYRHYLSRSLPILFPRLEEISIEEIHTLLEDGALTSVSLVHASCILYTLFDYLSLTDQDLH